MSMGRKMVIDQAEYEDWAKGKFIEYASTTVTYRKDNPRLMFGVFVVGGYKVTLGDETLYAGESFTEAQTAFNEAA